MSGTDWIALGLYGLVAAGEIYLFVLRRAALALCRGLGLPEANRFAMLPSWLLVLHCLLGTAGLVLLAYAFRQFGWMNTLALAIAPFALSVVVPLPVDRFAPMLTRNLERKRAAAAAAAVTR
jgi:hypothetical protein